MQRGSVADAEVGHDEGHPRRGQSLHPTRRSDLPRSIPSRLPSTTVPVVTTTKSLELYFSSSCTVFTVAA
eukprot:2470943-Pyramimonas_sp.AAC.1